MTHHQPSQRTGVKLHPSPISSPSSVIRTRPFSAPISCHLSPVTLSGKEKRNSLIHSLDLGPQILGAISRGGSFTWEAHLIAFA